MPIEGLEATFVLCVEKDIPCEVLLFGSETTAHDLKKTGLEEAWALIVAKAEILAVHTHGSIVVHVFTIVIVHHVRWSQHFKEIQDARVEQISLLCVFKEDMEHIVQEILLEDESCQVVILCCDYGFEELDDLYIELIGLEPLTFYYDLGPVIFDDVNPQLVRVNIVQDKFVDKLKN